MNLFNEEIALEIKKIQDKLAQGNNISVEEMKLVLLGLLNEEDANENKQ